MSEDKYLGNLYQRFPVTIEKGLGAHVWDVNNKEYIDCMGGYGVAVADAWYCQKRADFLQIL